MIYQLPTGKIINISIDDFLNMTDDDMQLMIATNFGVYGPAYNKSCYCEKSTEKCVIFHDELDIPSEDESIITIDQIILLSDLMSEYVELDIPDDSQDEELE